MNLECRLLGHSIADGPANMATDEALLDSVAADPRFAVIRTYEWSIPTLSLGYFQNYSEAEADPRWASVPIVRRATGGGALWHDREITYAVVIPNMHPSARPSRALYQSLHEGIAALLQSRGCAAGRRGPIHFEEKFDGRPFLCFTDRDPEDIVFQTTKLVGSAQRRRHGAVLQHGSLLLSRSRTTPELPGLADLTTLPGSASEWANSLQMALAGALGGVSRLDELSLMERQKAMHLQEVIYRQETWTRKR